MPVSAAEVAELRRLHDERQSEVLPLYTFAEIFGYVTAIARAEGYDEADCVELVARAIELESHHLRQAERVLRALGYRLVADRLRKLARRKRCC